MLIDWFTVGAQVFNFLILIWFMKRFLYHPILNAIDTREKHIALELKNADDKKSEAQNEHQEFQKKNEDFDKNRATLLNKLNGEIKSERVRLLEEVRKEANILALKRQDSLKDIEKKFYEKIKYKTEKEVFEVATKVLKDLSTTTLEKSICHSFILRLHELSPEEKKEFVDSIKNESAVIHTYFNLAEDQRTQIQNSIDEAFLSKVPLRFETSPKVIGGIELMAHGRKISWCIGDYLDAMDQSFLIPTSPSGRN